MYANDVDAMLQRFEGHVQVRDQHDKDIEHQEHQRGRQHRGARHKAVAPEAYQRRRHPRSRTPPTPGRSNSCADSVHVHRLNRGAWGAPRCG